MRDFTLTESTCDQAALVYARSKGWDEWFSNPTAGPWKRIKVPGVGDLAASGFGKIETRPDLILYYGNTDDKKVPVLTDPKILITESKDDIDKLDEEQLEKTCKNFLDIKIKLEALIKTSTDKTLLRSADSINYICSYVVGNQPNISTKIDELKKIHFKFIDKSIFPNFVVIIVKKDGYELSTEIREISQNDTKQIASLEEIF